MTITSGVEQLVKRGYSAAQAQFLRLVMRHSGAFMMRHFGVKPGAQTDLFSERLTRHGYARIDALNRRYVFTLAPSIYRLVGIDPRPARFTIVQLRQQLMCLDYVLGNSGEYLADESELLTYFGDVPQDKIPQKRNALVGRTAYFPERFPIRSLPGGGAAFVYPDCENLDVFRSFVRRHRRLMASLPRAEVVYLCDFEGIGEAARLVFDREIRRGIGGGAALEQDFREQQYLDGIEALTQDQMSRLRFLRARNREQYQAWLLDPSIVNQAEPKGDVSFRIVLVQHDYLYLNQSRFRGNDEGIVGRVGGNRVKGFRSLAVAP